MSYEPSVSQPGSCRTKRNDTDVVRRPADPIKFGFSGHGIFHSRGLPPIAHPLAQPDQPLDQRSVRARTISNDCGPIITI
jgi:hypothetical protein